MDGAYHPIPHCVPTTTVSHKEQIFRTRYIDNYRPRQQGSPDDIPEKTIQTTRYNTQCIKGNHCQHRRLYQYGSCRGENNNRNYKNANTKTTGRRTTQSLRPHYTTPRTTSYYRRQSLDLNGKPYTLYLTTPRDPNKQDNTRTREEYKTKETYILQMLYPS
jgi:hypothetical protein